MKWKRERSHLNDHHPTWTVGSSGFSRPGAFVTDFAAMKPPPDSVHRFTVCAWTRRYHMDAKAYATQAEAKAAANRWLRARRVRGVPK